MTAPPLPRRICQIKTRCAPGPQRVSYPSQTYGLSDTGLTSVPPTEAAALQRVVTMCDTICHELNQALMLE